MTFSAEFIIFSKLLFSKRENRLPRPLPLLAVGLPLTAVAYHWLPLATIPLAIPYRPLTIAYHFAIG